MCRSCPRARVSAGAQADPGRAEPGFWFMAGSLAAGRCGSWPSLAVVPGTPEARSALPVAAPCRAQGRARAPCVVVPTVCVPYGLQQLPLIIVLLTIIYCNLGFPDNAAK